MRQGKGLFCGVACYRANGSGPKPRPLDERLWEKVTRSDDHWIWGGKTDRKGYGLISDQARRGYFLQAHRVAWVLASGEPIPDGLDVLHTCDTPPCLRNEEPGVYIVDGVELPRWGHLFLGTTGDNMRDMVAKGRHFAQAAPEKLARGERHGSRLHPELYRGERSGNTKLTDAVIREIRQRRAAGVTLTRLADDYGVTFGTIWKIVERRSWAHVS